MNFLTFVGLTMGGHTIEDIRVTVPYNTPVEIPVEDALNSKDLWRALSQKHIFQLHVGPIKTKMIPPPPTQEEAVSASLLHALANQKQTIEHMAVQHSKELAETKAELQATRKLLEMVVSNMQAPRQSVAPTFQTAPQAAPRVEAVPVTEDIPIFIPSTIRDESLVARVSTTQEEVSATNTSDSRDKLRNLKKGK